MDIGAPVGRTPHIASAGESAVHQFGFMRSVAGIGAARLVLVNVQVGDLRLPLTDERLVARLIG